MQIVYCEQPKTHYYFANNKIQHFSFNADEQFLPDLSIASEDNKKITHLDDSLKSF
jgi:type I restriction enzyme R subunit